MSALAPGPRPAASPPGRRTARPRQLGRKLCLTLASSLLTCLLCEWIVRLTIGPQPKFPRRVVEGPFGLRINEPGAVYRHQSADVSVWFRINSKGLRADRDYPYEKPAGVRRVVCLGDSFTAGYEVDLEECFTRVLERELTAAGRRVEVLNAGVSGFGTAEELLYLERELIKYSPDVVVISFYGNDFSDNVRSDLFELDHGELRSRRERYVPLGALGNFLNSNALFNFLSERSDAFALAKEATTRILKGKIVQENLAAIDAAAEAAAKKPGDAATPKTNADYSVALTVALYDRLYAFCRGHAIALMIQSIPSNRANPTALVDLFPRDRFDLARPGLFFQSDKELLDPSLATELLYWKHSTGHWTPFSHRVCGKALADRIVREGLLEK
jgi:lysophospholipase L1-like esterase